MPTEKPTAVPTFLTSKTVTVTSMLYRDDSCNEKLEDDTEDNVKLCKDVKCYPREYWIEGNRGSKDWYDECEDMSCGNIIKHKANNYRMLSNVCCSVIGEVVPETDVNGTCNAHDSTMFPGYFIRQQVTGCDDVIAQMRNDTSYCVSGSSIVGSF